MKRMLLFPVLLLSLVMFAMTSCSGGYQINGNTSIAGLDGKMLYIKALQEGEWVAVDSAEVLHGAFKMSGAVDSVIMVTLYMDEESIMPLVLEEGKIQYK